MPSKRFWREMPTTEFDGDTSEWIAVLPLAAIEQHGPHLPVGVDALIAEGMGRTLRRCLAGGQPGHLPAPAGDLQVQRATLDLPEH